MKNFQRMINIKVLNPRAANRISVRFFSTHRRNQRNKSILYNCDDRPEPILDEKFREKVKIVFDIQGNEEMFKFQLADGYKHPRSIPIVVPSQDFTKSFLSIFNKGISNEN